MKITDVKPEEYNPYYQCFIETSTDLSLLEAFDSTKKYLINFYKAIPEDKYDYAYEEGKWTVKEILNHLIDVERIFSYRALRFARKETIDLPGFDQDQYVINANVLSRSLDSLLEEYSAVRQATISLFKSFSDDDLLTMGKASGSAMSVRALGFMILGHEKHHLKVLQERYL
ncbi:MAG: DinB family protein [Flavobacteriaceae bacterium]|nr:DinB family protein [Flavobacteriaceae bacterium]